jgi:glycine/serine hydroxymethyltransferase
MGAIEVTRSGMREPEIITIAEISARVLVRGERRENVRSEAIELRKGFATLYHCSEDGVPSVA